MFTQSDLMGITEENFKRLLGKIASKLPALEFATAVRIFRALRTYQPDLGLPETNVTNVGSISLFWKLNTGPSLETFLVEIIPGGEVEWLYEAKGRTKWLYVSRWDDAVPLMGADFIKRF